MEQPKYKETTTSPFSQFMADKVEPLVTKKAPVKSNTQQIDTMAKNNNLKPYLDKFDHLKQQK